MGICGVPKSTPQGPLKAMFMQMYKLYLILTGFKCSCL